MEGIDRASMLLLSIGEDAASEVLKHLPPKLVQKVGTSMSKLSTLSKSQIEGVIEEFLSDAEKVDGISVDPVEFTKTVLKEALGNDNAEGFIEQIFTDEKSTGLDSLRWLDPKTVMNIIRNEHIQTIATILLYLDPDQTAEVLSLFAEEKRVELVIRMSEIESVKPEALMELGHMIDHQILNLKTRASSKLGGIKKVANVINQLNNDVEHQILEGLHVADADLCETIKEKMFVFENLLEMDNRSVQRLLQDVNQEKLLYALKGAEEKVRDKIYSNMSRRAAELLKDDITAKGPVKLSEVESAQKEILEKARSLADKGEISIGGKQSDMMV